MTQHSHPNEPAVWSGPRPFVGREETTDTLMSQVDAGVDEGGRAVFVLGPEGSGKTTCVKLFQELAFRRHRDLRAEYVDCTESGADTWAQLAMFFTRGHRLKRSARRLAWEWLDVIPILGPFITAIVKTVRRVRTGQAEPRYRSTPRSAGESAVDAVRALAEYGPEEPRLIILDSLDRGDSEDLAGASALMRRLSDTRIVFLATTRTRDRRPPGAVADLILEAERQGVAHRVEVSPLDPDAVREAVETATKTPVPDPWVDWLMTRTGGLPGALWSALGELEEADVLQRSGRTWSWNGSPAEVDLRPGATEARIAELDAEDRWLLALAALEGRVFHSVILAALADLSELEVEDRLSRLARGGLVAYEGEREVGDDITSLYAFEDSVPITALAEQLAEPERGELSDRAHSLQRSLGLRSGPA